VKIHLPDSAPIILDSTVGEKTYFAAKYAPCRHGVKVEDVNRLLLHSIGGIAEN
jgi:chromosome condensin MukBEF ATPase and DNA-binding subunit MukB